MAVRCLATQSGGLYCPPRTTSGFFLSTSARLRRDGKLTWIGPPVERSYKLRPRMNIVTGQKANDVVRVREPSFVTSSFEMTLSQPCL